MLIKLSILGNGTLNFRWRMIIPPMEEFMFLKPVCGGRLG
jgi:hypothetical protein